MNDTVGYRIYRRIAKAQSLFIPVRLADLEAAVLRYANLHQLPALSCAVHRHGSPVWSVTAVAERLQHDPEQALLPCFSATKGVVSMAAWCLIEDFRLDPRRPVANYIPGFGRSGTADLSLWHLLTHTSGFAGRILPRSIWPDREARLREYDRWHPDHPPGMHFAYHATSAHWIIADIIQAVSGNDFRIYIRDRLLKPLEIEDLYVGLPEQRFPDACDVQLLYREVGNDTEVNAEFMLAFNDETVRKAGVPGAGGFGSADALAALYQVLLRNGVGENGRRVLKESSVADGVRLATGPEHRDAIRDCSANRTMGLVLAGNDGDGHLRGFGRSVSAEAVGHPGAGGQVAWADPATGISFCFLTSGFTDPITSGRRMTALGSLAGVIAEPRDVRSE